MPKQGRLSIGHIGAPDSGKPAASPAGSPARPAPAAPAADDAAAPDRAPQPAAATPGTRTVTLTLADLTGPTPAWLLADLCPSCGHLHDSTCPAPVTGPPPGLTGDDGELTPLGVLVEEAADFLAMRGYLDPDGEDYPAWVLAELAEIAQETPADGHGHRTTPEGFLNPSAAADHFMDRREQEWEHWLPEWACNCGRQFKLSAEAPGIAFYDARPDGQLGDLAGDVRPDTRKGKEGKVRHSDPCPGCGIPFADTIAGHPVTPQAGKPGPSAARQDRVREATPDDGNALAGPPDSEEPDTLFDMAPPPAKKSKNRTHPDTGSAAPTPSRSAGNSWPVSATIKRGCTQCHGAADIAAAKGTRAYQELCPEGLYYFGRFAAVTKRLHLAYYPERDAPPPEPGTAGDPLFAADELAARAGRGRGSPAAGAGRAADRAGRAPGRAGFHRRGRYPVRAARHGSGDARPLPARAALRRLRRFQGVLRHPRAPMADC